MEATNKIVQTKGLFLVPLVLLIFSEMFWSWYTNQRAYGIKDTLANLGVFFGFQFTKLLFYGIQLQFLSWLSTFAIEPLPRNWVTFLIGFFVVDFVYYWYHRFSHRIKFLWAFHLIHHSSLFMNLTVAYRLNWLNALITPLVLAPLVLLGFPLEYVILSFAFNLLYQFFLHTEAVGKLGILEGILSTPSAHRVHHASNKIYLDKNFGGVLIIWDRLFGTYTQEQEKPVYGTTLGFISNNPLVLNFKGFFDYLRGRMDSKG
jgi:sterol desaturase/sphingolipid hydroxylase (fatty acid hydroxylase superfamily)